jgi:hypothetical protein
VNINLPDQSDTSAMCGPTVEVKIGSDGMSVQVGHGFGVTALTTAEWERLEAERGNKPYVLVDFQPGYRKPFVSPLRTYAEAMAEFNNEMKWPTRWRDYRPHTGRSLRVMSQADYLKACEKWSQA